MNMKNVDQSKKQTCLIFFVSEIKIASENDLLYENFAIANTDDWELVQSIRELGIQEPLILSTDGYLLSGHRRYAAARFLGLKKVPVRHTDISFGSLTIPEKLKLLRTYNQQRERKRRARKSGSSYWKSILKVTTRPSKKIQKPLDRFWGGKNSILTFR